MLALGRAVGSGRDLHMPKMAKEGLHNHLAVDKEE
jgi:hypothetical protein